MDSGYNFGKRHKNIQPFASGLCCFKIPSPSIYHICAVAILQIQIIQLEHDLQILVKFMFPKKATKIDEIFTVDLTLCGKCQINFFMSCSSI